MRYSKNRRKNRRKYFGGGVTQSNANHIDDSEQRLRALTARVDAGIYIREQQNIARTLADRR